MATITLTLLPCTLTTLCVRELTLSAYLEFINITHTHMQALKHTVEIITGKRTFKGYWLVLFLSNMNMGPRMTECDD